MTKVVTHDLYLILFSGDFVCNLPETQKPLWHGGIAIRKVFARPKSFVRNPWEVSGPSGKFPDSLDIFRMVRKVSG